MTRASAPAYDRFKTVVAVILVVILLLMLLRGCATTVPPSAPAELAPAASATVLPPTLAPPTETLPAANPTASPTSTPLAPTLTPTAAQAAAEPSLTPTAAAAEAPTPTLTQAAADSGSNASCNTVAPSRLSAGQKARVIQRLNVRSAASITASIVKVNPANTQVEIIGGPTCEPVGGHAYLWWQIHLADGTEGWSAESPLNSAGYFLEPAS